MAGVQNKPKNQKQKSIAEIKEGIERIVVSEGGKLDASLLKKKFKDHLGKTIPRKIKITDFVTEHMNDDFEVIREESVAFIKSKTKRKDRKKADSISVGKTRQINVQPPTTDTSDNKQDIESAVDIRAQANLSYDSNDGQNTLDITDRPTQPIVQNHTNLPSCMKNELNRAEISLRPVNVLPMNPIPMMPCDTYTNHFPLLHSTVQLPTADTYKPLQPQQLPKQKPVGFCKVNASSHDGQHYNHDSPLRDIKHEVEMITEELCKLDHHVQVDLVEKRLFERFKVNKLRELGNYRKVDDVPGIRDLIRKQREINVSIQAFVSVRSVCTVYELDKYLAHLYDAQAYEDLKLGPLVKHPLVYEHFKFPSNVDPPEITTLKVMKYLKQFMSKNGWTNKVDMPEFLEYLKEQMSCETLYELGVRINSVGLIIKSIKNCCSDESVTRREAEQRMMKEIAEEIEQQIPRIKKQLLGSTQHDPDALVNQLLDLSPVDILQKLFAYCEKYFEGKTRTVISKFVMKCNSDKQCRKLFQLAIHKACRDLIKPVDDFLEKNDVGTKASVADDKLKSAKHDDLYTRRDRCPSRDELLNEIRGWLSLRSIDLKLLARVEDSVLDHYKGFTTFRDLGQGTFLQLLSEDKEIETMITVSSNAQESVIGIRMSDAIDLIQQCDVNSAKTEVYKAVRAQYNNLNRSINENSLDGLIAQAREQQKSRNDKVPVVYEACLVPETLDSIYVKSPADEARKKEHVGALGYQDKDTVLKCLYQTPLLEDFITWSEWHSVFEPTYGDIKSYLKNISSNRNPAKSNDEVYAQDLVAIETSSGSLLRITRITSTDDFLRYAKNGDVIGTSGHLISLVIQYGGVNKAPVALLASHMKEAFLSLNVEENQESTKLLIRFTIKCLLRVPSLLRQALAMKIFIEPLKLIYGNVQTPGLVLKYCETFEEKCMIHSLGIHFGVSEWLQDFKKKLEFTMSRGEESTDGIQEEVAAQKVGTLHEAMKEKVSSSDHDGSSANRKMLNHDHDEITEDVSNDVEEKMECPKNNTSDREQECQAVVDSIRREEFGIGIEFPPEHRQMMQNQRSREGRGLHRLSSELYSKDTHFVLELVQNADDNRYGDNIPFPSIAFFVSVEKIEVFNNEVGFEEKNIRAICDVGKSTKGKQRYGYIGQKGIGFKSVFRITDTPEVHSNGYHIKFDAKCGPTGYILPHWCTSKTEENTESWTTCIVLPLKEEMKDAQKKTLIARFHDIQPSLLLFLRRLRQIKIHDEVSKTTREMFRRDCGEKLIEITHTSGTDLWFVVKKELPASSMKDDIERTEVALAFPLPPRTSSQSTISLDDVTAFIQAKSLIQQPVFAFLPLRSYGFRFIIQGDFDVPSSREDVDKDSAWNQWLRQEIATLFVQAFDDFKVHKCFADVSSIVQLLHFIPLEDEILDFFKPITQTILNGISRKQCIPVLFHHSTNDSISILDSNLGYSETAEDGDLEIKWVYPSQVVVAEDHLIEELISDQILNRYLNKYYLHPDLKDHLHSPLRRVLQIETISCRHLIDIGKTIARVVEMKMDSEEVRPGLFEELAKWVSKWLCSLYRCLERERDCSDETLQEIAKISIFPLSKGKFASIFGQPVFLPLQEIIKGEQAKTKASRKAAEIVHKEMLSLHPLILEHLDDIGRSQVKKLLERLQVKCLTSRDLIKHHIIPALRTTQNTAIKHPDVIYSYIVYIKDQLDLEPGVCNLEELRSCALIKTNKGFVNPSVEPVHFTIEYGNKTNLQKEFPSVPWTVVDNCYITGRDSRVSWEKFLSALGVVHFVAIERKDICSSRSQLANSVWASLSEYWPQTAGNYVIKDYESNELEILLSAGSDDELKMLAEMFDIHWDEMYSRYSKDIPYVDEQDKALGVTSSSFFLHLKEKPWFPTTSSSKSHSKLLRCCPRDVFIRKSEVIDLLGDHALYAASPSLANENFLKALGIRTSVKFDTLVSELSKWIAESENEDTGFATSLEHMINVYKFLENKITNSEERKNYLNDVTKDRPVVFVPSQCHDGTPHESTSKLRGKFLPRKLVYWSDPSNLMHEYRNDTFSADPRRKLEGYYPPLKDFFVEFLKIDAVPKLKEYLDLLEKIAFQNSMASGPVVDNMMRVYEAIATKCVDSTNTNFAKAQLLNSKVFPTTDEKWVSLDEKPLFCDDKSLAKLFRNFESQKEDDETSHAKANEDKVHFIKMGLLPKHRKPKKDKTAAIEETENRRIREKVDKFFREVCGIRNLSECVSREIVPSLISKCFALQLFLCRWIPYVQRYLYHKHPEQHEKHQELETALSNVQCFSAEELEVVHRLSTHPRITVSVKKTCAFVKNDDNLMFYVTDSELKDSGNIITELTQYFLPPESVGDFSNFLHVLTRMSTDGIENYMESQGLEYLPDDVTMWTIPEPEPLPILIQTTTEEPDESFPIPDSSETVEVDQPTDVQETDGEPRGLQCWPPRSPGTPALTGIRNKNPTTEQVLAAWPLPAPPEAYVSPNVEVVAKPASNVWQPQPQYDPTVVQVTTTFPSEATNLGNQTEHDNTDHTTSPSANDQHLQSALQETPSQASEVNSSNDPKDTNHIFNPPPTSCHNGVTRDDVIRQPYPQYVRPLELGNVRVELEEVDLGTALGETVLISLAQSANAEEIGRWGEECVYVLLRNIEKESQVIWVNESGESMLPYDIIIKAQDTEIFIEVKTTSTSEKKVLEMSSQEIKYAFEKQESYHLYRVYNAGNPNNCRVARLRNLASSLDSKAVSLFILI